MTPKISYMFYAILVISGISRCLCVPPSDKLEKHNLFDIDGFINSFFPPGGGDNNNSGNDGGNPPANNQNQVNSPQGNSWNNANANPGINYPGNSQVYPGQNSQDRPQFPGNTVNNGVYPGNPQQGNNNQRYPGNGFNGNPNVMQGNNPRYPGNDVNNGNPNYNYPGNPNGMQGINPQYPTQANGLNHINRRPGINYPTNPSDSNQGNYPQYPTMGNNWNNNRYPGNYQKGPIINAESPYPATNWNDANGLQNNPNQIGAGNQQTQGFNQNPIIQGQPSRYPDTYQNYNPGLQNGFPSQVGNGLNNQLNGNLQDPNMQYPQLAGGITTGNPLLMPTATPPVVSTTSEMKQCAQDCPATSEYSPLCGNDNVTYFNKGKFDCARRCGIDVSILRSGTCIAATGIHHRAGVYA